MVYWKYKSKLHGKVIEMCTQRWFEFYLFYWLDKEPPSFFIGQLFEKTDLHCYPFASTALKFSLRLCVIYYPLSAPFFLGLKIRKNRKIVCFNISKTLVCIGFKQHYNRYTQCSNEICRLTYLKAESFSDFLLKMLLLKPAKPNFFRISSKTF